MSEQEDFENGLKMVDELRKSVDEFPSDITEKIHDLFEERGISVPIRLAVLGQYLFTLMLYKDVPLYTCQAWCDSLITLLKEHKK